MRPLHALALNLLAPRPVMALVLALVMGLAVSPARAVVPTAVALPFGASCDVGRAATARHLSVDSGSNFWAVAQCATQVFVTSSRDGGLTWEPLTQLAASGADGQATVKGGTLPGHAVVAWQAFPNLLVRSTTDFGATWSPAVALAPVPPNPAIRNASLSIVAEGTHYHVMVAEDFANSVHVRSSLDRGATWQPLVSLSMPWAYGDLVHDAVADTLELVSDDPNLWRRTSTDHGATFGPLAMQPAPCCIVGSDWALGGGRLLHGVGYQPNSKRVDLGAASSTDQLGLSDSIRLMRSVDADAAGNAFVASREEIAAHRVLLQRLAASGSPAAAPLVLDVDGVEPNVATCDVDAAAVLWRALSGVIYFNKTCFSGGSCCVPVTNLPPVCNAGGPYQAECAGSATALALDASGSSDPDGLVLTATWSTSCPGGVFDDPTSLSPTLLVDGSAGCPVTCDVTLVVSDGVLTSRCVAAVSIVDTSAPSVVAASSPAVTLWPPNHRLVTLEASVLAPRIVDACDTATTWQLVDCVSDQPDDATGDGHTSGDCSVSADGTSFTVRAERDGAQPEGRTYTLMATATDGCGNTSGALVAGTVHVQRDQR